MTPNTSEQWTQEEIDELNQTWSESLGPEGKMHHIAKPFIAVHAFRITLLIDQIIEDEIVWKKMSEKRLGKGNVERQYLDKCKEWLVELFSVFTVDVDDSTLEEVQGFYNASINRWVVFLEELGCKYSTKFLTSANFLVDCLDSIGDQQHLGEWQKMQLDVDDVVMTNGKTRKKSLALYKAMLDDEEDPAQINIFKGLVAEFEQQIADVQSLREWWASQEND